MFNPVGQVMLIITSQQQVVSAVAGIKCTPPFWKLNIAWHCKSHLGMTKRRGDAVVCQEAFGKGGKVALLVKPEQKLWFNINNLRKVSLCKWKEGEVVREKTFTSWQSCYGPSIVNVEHFYFQGRVPIQMRYFFSWRHDWLTSWPIQVLRNQTNIFFSMMSVQLSDLYRYCKARQTP